MIKSVHCLQEAEMAFDTASYLQGMTMADAYRARPVLPTPFQPSSYVPPYKPVDDEAIQRMVTKERAKKERGAQLEEENKKLKKQLREIMANATASKMLLETVGDALAEANPDHPLIDKFVATWQSLRQKYLEEHPAEF